MSCEIAMGCLIGYDNQHMRSEVEFCINCFLIQEAQKKWKRVRREEVKWCQKLFPWQAQQILWPRPSNWWSVSTAMEKLLERISEGCVHLGGLHSILSVFPKLLSMNHLGHVFVKMKVPGPTDLEVLWVGHPNRQFCKGLLMFEKHCSLSENSAKFKHELWRFNLDGTQILVWHPPSPIADVWNQQWQNLLGVLRLSCQGPLLQRRGTVSVTTSQSRGALSPGA